MKKLYQNVTFSKRIVAYLFVAMLFFSLGYLAGSAKQTGSDNAAVIAGSNGMLWENAKVKNARMIAASERNSAAAVKLLPGIADALVQSHRHPEWERNVWARTQSVSAHAAFDSTLNKPLPAETIEAVGRIVAANFGITDLQKISIADVRNSLTYDGSGERIMPPKGTCECSCCRHDTLARREDLPPF